MSWDYRLIRSSIFYCNLVNVCHCVCVFVCSISPPIQDILDISQVAQNLAGNFMDVVQYNRDNTAFEVR